MSGAIGQGISRVDGPAKVTDAARYSGEIALPGLAYAALVGAGIASGRVTAIARAQRVESRRRCGIDSRRHRVCFSVNHMVTSPAAIEPETSPTSTTADEEITWKVQHDESRSHRRHRAHRLQACRAAG
jgi:hypothetical protein